MVPPVVISAAGRGTRMNELTHDKPKHLISVAGRPFLRYVLDNLYKAGAQEVYLVIGHQAQAAYQFVEAYRKRYPVHVVNQFERVGSERYGTLMPLLSVAPELQGQPVVAVNGDNLYSSHDLSDFFKLVSGCAVAGVEHEHPERYGVLVHESGILKQIIEKPTSPPSRLVNTGLYGFSSAMWQVLPEVGLSPRGEYELTDAVSLLARQEPVRVFPIADYWLDFGRPEDIPKVEAVVAKAGHGR